MQFLPRLDIEQLQEETLFFLAEDPATDGSVLDRMAKYFLTMELLIEKIIRHPHVERTTLNYIRFFGGSSGLLALDASTVAEPELESEKQKQRIEVLSQLKVPERMRLAVRGNRSARFLLLRDSNLQVVLSVLENPRLTVEEVEELSQSSNMPNEVLRRVARNPAWTRRHSIVAALTSNPKTPLSVSLGFLKHLREKDLLALSKNRGIPAALRNTAAQMLQGKRAFGL